jgi:hypothetical protein
MWYKNQEVMRSGIMQQVASYAFEPHFGAGFRPKELLKLPQSLQHYTIPQLNMQVIHLLSGPVLAVSGHAAGFAVNGHVLVTKNPHIYCTDYKDRMGASLQGVHKSAKRANSGVD